MGNSRVKESDLDTEKIAALLAGTLSETERAAALERLASSHDDFRLFMEAAAVLREVEDEAGVLDPQTGGVGPAEVVTPAGEAGGALSPALSAAAAAPIPPSAAPQWRRRRIVPWIAPVLAGAAAVIVLLVVLRQPSRPTGLAAPVAVLTRTGLPAGAIEQHPWNPTLGTQGALAPTARAARVGALHTELALALRSRDSVAAARVAAQIETVLSGESLAAPTRNLYRRAVQAVASEPRESATLLARAGEGAGAVLGTEWMEAGAWAEAARIAAADHDDAFFSAPSTRAALGRAGRLHGLGSSARDALVRVRVRVEAGRPYRWDALEAGTRDLLGALAS